MQEAAAKSKKADMAGSTAVKKSNKKQQNKGASGASGTAKGRPGRRQRLAGKLAQADNAEGGDRACSGKAKGAKDGNDAPKATRQNPVKLPTNCAAAMATKAGHAGEGRAGTAGGGSRGPGKAKAPQEGGPNRKARRAALNKAARHAGGQPAGAQAQAPTVKA